jgi:hypothetical protein
VGSIPTMSIDCKGEHDMTKKVKLSESGKGYRTYELLEGVGEPEFPSWEEKIPMTQRVLIKIGRRVRLDPFEENFLGYWFSIYEEGGPRGFQAKIGYHVEKKPTFKGILNNLGYGL